MKGCRHLLLSGAPGVGKTTLILRVAEGLGERRVGGFVTKEIRGSSGRLGFRAITFAGEKWTISHVDFPGPVQVGRYGVDLEAVDRLAEVLERAIRDRVDLCLVDEVGKMECLSERFVSSMKQLLESEIPTVATVSARGGGPMAEIKQRSDSELWDVTVSNRDQLVEQARRWLAERKDRVEPDRPSR